MNLNSPSVQRSLRILRDHGPMSPSWFANRYFPEDHPGWKRVCKCGPHGSHAGSGLVMWAGGWIGKLRAEGLVRHHGKYNQHILTPGGGVAAIKEKTDDKEKTDER